MNRRQYSQALAIAFLIALRSSAQVQVVSPAVVQTVFSGQQRKLEVVFHNSTKAAAEIALGGKLFQLTSATAVPLLELPSKKLELLAGQTVYETVLLDFPDVRSPTRFLVQWIGGQSGALGRTEVLVYPRDLLKDLKMVLGTTRVGVLDPQNELKPLLKSVAVEADDLEQAEMEQFSGKLIIAGPFGSAKEVPAQLGKRLRQMRDRGIGSVWIQPPQHRSPNTDPSYFVAGTAEQPAIVIAAAEMVADIQNNPAAQLRLLKMSSLALAPKPFEIPSTKE